MIHKLTYIFLLTAVFFGSACHTGKQNETDKAEAIIYWSGEYMVDGCGFEVEMNGKKYKPENEDAIPEVFKKQEQSKVELTYALLDETIDRRCGLATVSREMPAIRIVYVEAK
ncbi:hypothetical protein [Pontibacter sp. SGAir0037]|uniref:hypothetical protein n=1 Tax=Pontibacter sp. SGAir0037 TaxID=2571030 RepID=UPI0010CCC82D|nr:hypothetical protein [Pontibacter sp. SGAir0037]QCR21786.1 hypothetical protein C1N53_05120 [Pontibacter sp. SGAir0037]